MKTYLVTFDHKELDEMESYAAIESLKKFSGWAKLFPGVWLVKSDDSAEEVFNRIIFPKDERIVVIKVELAEYYGLHSGDIWDWVRSNI